MPKRHILARNRVVWGITRENRFGALAVECWKNPEKRSRVNHLWCAISYAIFCDDRLTGLGVARGRISHFPIDLCRRPYYILARLKTLPSVRKRTGTPTSQSLNATSSIMAKNIQNSNCARTHPCLVPFVILNAADISPLSITWPIMPSWSERIMFTNFCGHLIFNRTCQNSCPVNRVKCLSKVYKHRKQILVLFTTLLLYLSCGENHVHSASTGSKSALAFRDDVAEVHVSV